MKPAVVALLALTLCGVATAGKQIRWVPDKHWATIVAHVMRGDYTRVQIACMRPIVPAKTAATFNVVQEDCILIANNHDSVFCGEVAWQNGPLPPEPLDCVAVARSFKQDLKPAWVLVFRFPARPPKA